MSCSLPKLIASRSVVRPVAKTSRRLYNLKHEGRCTYEIRHLFDEAICPRQPATRNLTRLLNMMDNRIGVTPAACARWEVTEDAKALYITRDMSGLPNKDYVAPRSLAYPHRISYGCVYIHHWSVVIGFTVGLEGPDPGAAYPGYHFDIHAPFDIFQIGGDRKVTGVENEVLTSIIPKNDKGKWTRNIKVKAKFYWPPKCIQDINPMLQTL